MRYCLAGLVLCLLVAGCSKGQAQKASLSATTDNGEPTEEVLRILHFRSYAEIEKAGGLPVTLTQTGQGFVIKPKLHEVHKEKCVPTPYIKKDSFECHLNLVLSLNGGKPGPHGERVNIWRGPNGDWTNR
jgi:hypothetical protein